MGLTVATMSAEELRKAEEAEAAFYLRDSPGIYAIELLRSMEAMPPHGMPVNIFHHSLQAATRCLRDEQSDEMVVACLLHDLGGAFTAENHAAIAAEILRPFVTERTRWIVEHHALFQEYYYASRLGLDPHRRELYVAHPHYQATVEFCERWDVPSFDPGYEQLSLEAFEPMVRKIFSRPLTA